MRRGKRMNDLFFEYRMTGFLRTRTVGFFRPREVLQVQMKAYKRRFTGPGLSRLEPTNIIKWQDATAEQAHELMSLGLPVYFTSIGRL
jgi:hypothetical protein